MSISTERLDIRPLMDMQFSFAASRVLSTAVQLHLFSQLANGPKGAGEVARGCASSERGTRMLLDALVGFGLLTKSDGHYGLTPVAFRHLVRESPDYLGHLMEHDALWDAWTALPDAVRTGKPVRAVNRQEKAEAFFPALIRSLHVQHREPARALASTLQQDLGERPIRGIDVACGSAVWSIAYAECNHAAQLTAQDFPAMLELTRRFLDQHHVASRYDFLPGDLNHVDLGHGVYDLAWLGNIVHSEGERSARRLLHRLHRAMRPGGRIAIIDMVPDDRRTGPAFPLVFALNMLLNTEEGDTFTLGEYEAWLTESGFDHVQAVDIGVASPAILARRP